MRIDWAASGQAATVVVIALVIFVLAMRRAIRAERVMAEASRYPLARKNFTHDSEALGFAPNWPSNRLSPSSRQAD